MTRPRHRVREPAMWAVLGVLGALAFAWAAPRVYPLLPEWTTTRGEARDIALELLRDLGEPVADPYVVVLTRAQSNVEHLLQGAAREQGWERIRNHPLRDYMLDWAVYVYRPGTPRDEWAYRASIGRDGAVHGLERRIPDATAGETIPAPQARRRARETLERYGFVLASFDEPELRTQQLAERTDTVVRFPWGGEPLDEGVRVGIEVSFAGSRLAGFSQFIDDPQRSRRREALQPLALLNILPLLVLFILVPLLAIPFLKRYHAGEVGVHRGLQLAAVTFAALVAAFVVCARVMSQDWGIGVLTRQQTTWVMGLMWVRSSCCRTLSRCSAPGRWENRGPGNAGAASWRPSML